MTDTNHVVRPPGEYRQIWLPPSAATSDQDTRRPHNGDQARLSQTPSPYAPDLNTDGQASASHLSSALPVGGMRMSIGTPGRAMSMDSGLDTSNPLPEQPNSAVRGAATAATTQPTQQDARDDQDDADQAPAPMPWWARRPVKELPNGVLPPAGTLMSGLLGLVGLIAAAEAGYNIFKGASDLLHQPLLLALAWPALFEAAASSFAIQDLLDRRRGVENRQLKLFAYAGLVLSAAVGSTVGYLLHGPVGLGFGIASVVLGLMIHVHGGRATRAHRTRARLTPEWREQQQRAAETNSARDRKSVV